MSEWISVKDRLPEIKTTKEKSFSFDTIKKILNNQKVDKLYDSEYETKLYPRVLATDGKEVELVEFRKNHEWYVGCFASDSGTLRSPEPYSYDKYLRNVTHWMELPGPPTKPSEGNEIFFNV